MRMQLFCVPHAGGSASAFMRWRRFLPTDVDLVPVELPGRGVRMGEKPLTDARSAAADVARHIQDHRRRELPYAVWGHSMGSLIAFEAYHALDHQDRPDHMILSGRTAPHTDGRRSTLHRIGNDDAFIAAVDSYGGGTKEALAEPQLRELMLPILRADFELSETYQWSPKDETMSCPVTVVNGRQDTSVTHQRMHAWQELASQEIDFRVVEGDHFFLYTHQQPVETVVAGVRYALTLAAVQ